LRYPSFLHLETGRRAHEHSHIRRIVGAFAVVFSGYPLFFEVEQLPSSVSRRRRADARS